MLVYIAGKYNDDTPEKIEANIQKARAKAIELWKAGYTVICPHLNTAHFEKDLDLSNEEYVKRDLEILQKCDIVYVLDNWLESEGTHKELQMARDWGIPIFFSTLEMEEVMETEPTPEMIEGESPQQLKRGK